MSRNLSLSLLACALAGVSTFEAHAGQCVATNPGQIPSWSNPDAIVKRIQPYVFRIARDGGKGEYLKSGTATLVDTRGYFLTAAHNFKAFEATGFGVDAKTGKPTNTLFLQGPAGQAKIELVWFSPTNSGARDLALIQAKPAAVFESLNNPPDFILQALRPDSPELAKGIAFLGFPTQGNSYLPDAGAIDGKVRFETAVSYNDDCATSAKGSCPSEAEGPLLIAETKKDSAVALPGQSGAIALSYTGMALGVLGGYMPGRYDPAGAERVAYYFVPLSPTRPSAAKYAIEPLLEKIPPTKTVVTFLSSIEAGNYSVLRSAQFDDLTSLERLALFRGLPKKVLGEIRTRFYDLWNPLSDNLLCKGLSALIAELAGISIVTNGTDISNPVAYGELAKAFAKAAQASTRIADKKTLLAASETQWKLYENKLVAYGGAVPANYKYHALVAYSDTLMLQYDRTSAPEKQSMAIQKLKEATKIEGNSVLAYDRLWNVQYRNGDVLRAAKAAYEAEQNAKSERLATMYEGQWKTLLQKRVDKEDTASPKVNEARAVLKGTEKASAFFSTVDAFKIER